MLSYGANPNTEDFMGRTPLHYAVVGSHIETVDLLVFCGADASIVNKDGESPKALAQTKDIRAALLETDLLIKGIKSRNVAIEHLTLQADVVYRLADTRLVIRTPTGMGLAKTSLMVRRVVPEYSYYGPQPEEKELLFSDIYDFRISGAYVEEPLLLQIPVYSRAEQYEDVFVKTDRGIYSTPVRIARMVDANKEPHWICHARVCLYGIRSITLVARPRVEHFLVPEVGADLRSVLDPMVKIQFRQSAVTEETDVTFQVTSKPSYEEEEYDSILSMSHFFEIASPTMKPLQNDMLISLPLPENYLGHGVLHVLTRKQGDDPTSNAKEEWQELLRNPDYATDAVIIRLSSWGQICLLERNPQYPVRHALGPGGEAISMATSLYDKTRRREYSTCFLAMARPKPGACPGKAEVVVECVISSRVHARLHHWSTKGYVDLKPSHTMEFATIPKQSFVIKTGGRCSIDGLPLPPLQFHPKRNNCVRFTVLPKDAKGVEEGQIEVLMRIQAADARKVQLSQSRDSLHTTASSKLTAPNTGISTLAAQPSPITTTTTKTLQRHQSQDTLQLSRDQLLARIPLFLPWTAPPDDPRGQDNSENTNVSPFDMELPKTDIRGGETDAPTNTKPSAAKQQSHKKPQQQEAKKTSATSAQPSTKQATQDSKGKLVQKSLPTKFKLPTLGKAQGNTQTPTSAGPGKQEQLQQKHKALLLSGPSTKSAKPLTSSGLTAPVNSSGVGKLNSATTSAATAAAAVATGLILQPGKAARPKSGKAGKAQINTADTTKTQAPRPKSSLQTTEVKPTSTSRPKSSRPSRSDGLLDSTDVKTSPRPKSAPKSSRPTSTGSPTKANSADSKTRTSPAQLQRNNAESLGIRSLTPGSDLISREAEGMSGIIDSTAVLTPGVAPSSTASCPASGASAVGTIDKNEGVLEFLSRGLGEDWFRLGILLGVPYKTMQVWMEDEELGLQEKANKMLAHWKQTRRTRQDHGVPELLMTLQRIGKTQLVRSLKDRLRTWISDNLEKRGFLRGVVNKNMLEETENLEPMSPLFLLSLVRRAGFSIDFIYELGVSRPEVSRVMMDPLLKHREDKMLGLLLISRDKEPSADVALRKILTLLQAYDRTDAHQWTLTACRNWLTNQGCADDRFAHGVRDILLRQNGGSSVTNIDGEADFVEVTIYLTCGAVKKQGPNKIK